MSEEDEAYEIGVRDGYEDAIQDLDLATGGDGEFYGSTIDGGVDMPVMKRRIINRFDNQIETLKFIGPGLLVLRNMCAIAGLKLGEAKAAEMIAEVRRVLCDDASDPAAERTKADSQALNSIEQPHQTKIPTQPQGEGEQSP